MLANGRCPRTSHLRRLAGLLYSMGIRETTRLDEDSEGCWSGLPLIGNKRVANQDVARTPKRCIIVALVGGWGCRLLHLQAFIFGELAFFCFRVHNRFRVSCAFAWSRYSCTNKL